MCVIVLICSHLQIVIKVNYFFELFFTDLTRNVLFLFILTRILGALYSKKVNRILYISRLRPFDISFTSYTFPLNCKLEISDAEDKIMVHSVYVAN